MKPSLRVIDSQSADAAEAIRELRERLSPRGEVVSSRGRELTLRVFGADLSPAQVVERICGEVRQRAFCGLLLHANSIKPI